eukprot:TRINITY_DN1046_c0_g1_i1.p1 TRINITY_DN1046_c0_g1~~TRINITY_DN1046_c0_g1_i1.p1  ORF type:complete len:225 (-),score=49.27 TRINITY_DN1046_c0_g1_i1:37-711(-)
MSFQFDDLLCCLCGNSIFQNLNLHGEFKSVIKTDFQISSCGHLICKSCHNKMNDSKKAPKYCRICSDVINKSTCKSFDNEFIKRTPSKNNSYNLHNLFNISSDRFDDEFQYNEYLMDIETFQFNKSSLDNQLFNDFERKYGKYRKIDRVVVKKPIKKRFNEKKSDNPVPIYRKVNNIGVENIDMNKIVPDDRDLETRNRSLIAGGLNNDLVVKRRLSLLKHSLL